MKNAMKRFLSALMTLCMIAGVITLPTVHVHADESDDVSSEVEEVEITAETLLKDQSYSSEAEKLAFMTLYLDLSETYGYKLYAQELTGEVAVENVKTGQILFTNPYDAGDASTASDTLTKLFSQLQVNYEDNSGKSATLYSYSDAALLNQIKVNRIKNGIRLDYTIGRSDARRLCPMSVERTRFETLILAYIEDANDLKKMNAYYTKYFSSEQESETVKQSWLKDYPITAEMDIYTMAESSTNYEKNKVETIIRTWCPHYTYEDMEYDHELTKFTSSTEVMPVFKMSLEYKLDAQGLTVRLPANSISFNEAYYTLTSVVVLPYFGTGSSDYTGYTFVPDGSGSIIRFEDVKDTTYLFTGELYGPDNAYHTLSTSYTGKAETMRFPVFGLVEDHAYLYQLDENGNQTDVPYCEHNNKTELETVAPTCTEDGYTLYECLACGAQVKDKFVAAAHTYESVVTEPTCTSSGYTTFTCSVCGDSYVGKETDPAHKYTGTVTEPTCTEKGYTTYVCDYCGDTYVDDYTDPSHDYQEVEVEGKTKKKTCTENGYGVYECTKCGQSYETVLYAQHTLGSPKALEEYTDERKAYQYFELTCSVCKETFKVVDHLGTANLEAGTHDFTHTFSGASKIVHAEATCTSYGLVEGDCRKCGEHATQVVEPTHNYEIQVVEGTCTSGGYSINTCKTCGYSYESNYTEPKHNFVDTVVEPTCTTNGYTVHTCQDCGTVVTDTYTSAGHEWDAGFVDLDGKTIYHCTSCFTSTYTAAYVKATEKRGSSLKENTAVPKEEDYIGVDAPVEDVTSEATSDDVASGDVPADDIPADDVTSDATSGDVTSDVTSEGTGKVESDTTVPDGAYKKIITRGYVAIITEGDSLCTITSSHGGALHKYNSVYLTVNPRPSDQYNLADTLSVGSDSAWTVVSERKYTGSYTIRYLMLGEGTDYEASYSGMANAYRDYLLSNGSLTKVEANENGVPLTIETLGAVETQTTILSIPVYVMTPLTTFDDLKTITTELNGEGIGNINYRLTGYTSGGVNSLMPYSVKFESAVGGNDGYSDFISYAEQNGIGLFPEFDFSYVHSTAMFDGYSDSKHAVKTIDDRYITKKEYNATLQIFSNTGLLAVSPSVFEYFYNHMKEDLTELGYGSISAGTLGSDLNSDFDEDEPYNREDSKEFVIDLLEQMKEDSGDSVMLDGGNAYTYAYAKYILNMSLQGSEYLNTSASVPFTGMVLHGYINYSGSPTNQASSTQTEILKMIENGAYPYFLLCAQNTQALKESEKFSDYYSISYENWKADITEIYEAVNEALKDLQDVEFVGHEILNGERVAGEDELAADKIEGEEALAAAAEDLAAAKLAYENAIALYKRLIAQNKAEAAKNCFGNIATTKTAYEKAVAAMETAEKTYGERTSDYDENGQYITTKYSVTDGSIVRVSYANGTSYILNYNAFDVTVTVNGNSVTVPSFSYVEA